MACFDIEVFAARWLLPMFLGAMTGFTVQGCADGAARLQDQTPASSVIPSAGSASASAQSGPAAPGDGEAAPNKGETSVAEVAQPASATKAGAGVPGLEGSAGVGGSTAPASGQAVGRAGGGGSLAAGGAEAEGAPQATSGVDAGPGARGGASAPEGPARPSFIRLALLGDSITETSCTSQLVFDRLRADGHVDFDLVGTRRNEQGCGVDEPDRDCEGHSGYLVTELAPMGPKAAELHAWCEADRANVVLMHFGTNDAWNSGVPIADVLSAFSAVVAALRAAEPSVIVLAAQIIPMDPDGCSDCSNRVRQINEQVPMWALGESTAESPVYVVDHWTGFEVAQDTYDRVHPNMQGSQKMADAWLQALYARGLF